ncbi:homocysteine S-methyltransferase family protein, partial [Vibrio parahaemolyticus V-223/04]
LQVYLVQPTERALSPLM